MRGGMSTWRFTVSCVLLFVLLHFTLAQTLSPSNDVSSSAIPPAVPGSVAAGDNDAIKHIDSWSATDFGGFLALLLLFYSVKSIFYHYESTLRFLTQASLVALLLESLLQPYFDDRYNLFWMLNRVVLLTGALVFGVIGVLMPRLSLLLSVCVGSVVWLSISLWVFNQKTLSLVGNLGVTLCILLVCAFGWKQNEKKCELTMRVFRNAGLVSFLGVLSIDLLGFDGEAWYVFCSLIREELGQAIAPVPLMSNLCRTWVISVWCICVVGTIAIEIRQSISKWLKSCLTSRSARSRNSYGRYQSIPSFPELPAGAGSTSLPAIIPPQHTNPTNPSAANAGITNSDKPSPFVQRTFSYQDNLTSNYLDLDNLPPDFQQVFGLQVVVLAQRIMAIHGFQVDSSRNQSEHLIMLLYNEVNENDREEAMWVPVWRVHKRLFTNYLKWCEKLQVEPLLLAHMAVQKSHEALLEDLLVWLLMWGEAANLRHMPECLCLLFHKTMEMHLRRREFWVSSDGRGGAPNSGSGVGVAQRYPGFYLDMVITPLYEVVAKALLKNLDHVDRRNYDDLNEFFWHPNCLQYPLFDGNSEFDLPDTQLNGTNNSRPRPTLAEALATGKKTYMEKRSWLHPVYAMHRVVEWHLLTFSLLAVLSFADLLKWTTTYTIQVTSGVLLEISFFRLVWVSLEVWTMAPPVEMSDAARFGYVLRLLAGFFVFVYQSIYFHWAFVTSSSDESTVSSPLDSVPLYSEGDAQFWWWQYVWLSLFASSVWIVAAVTCWLPGLQWTVSQWRAEIVQALFSVLSPATQLYNGRLQPRPQNEVSQYLIFWISLLAFKLWFGYYYVVSPAAVPTLELYDTHMNYGSPGVLGTAALMCVWWFPHLLVYCIDLSIWYTVWASIVGGMLALRDRLGAVRDSDSMRGHFMRAPRLFADRFMSWGRVESRSGAANWTGVSVNEKDEGNFSGILSTSDSALSGIEFTSSNSKLKSHLSTIALDQILPQPVRTPRHFLDSSNNSSTIINGGNTSNSTSLPQSYQQPEVFPPGTSVIAGGNNPFSQESKSAQNLPSSFHNLGAQSGNSGDQLLSGGSLTPLGSLGASLRQSLGDSATKKASEWLIFARIWNEVVRKLRLRDHISNTERDWLLFSQWEWLSRPVYLPLFQTAGAVDRVKTAFCDVLSGLDAPGVTSEEQMRVTDGFADNVGVEALEAVAEAWELGSWMTVELLGCGVESIDQRRNVGRAEVLSLIAAVERWSGNGELFCKVNSSGVSASVRCVGSIATLLNKGLRDRAKNPLSGKLSETDVAGKQTSSVSNSTGINVNNNSSGGRRMTKSLSTGFLSSLDEGAAPDAGVGGNRYAPLRPFRKSNASVDILRDSIRDELRQWLSLLRNTFKTMLAKYNDNVTVSLLSPTNGDRRGGRSLLFGTSEDLDDCLSSLSTLLSAPFFTDDLYATTCIDKFCADHRASPAISKLVNLIHLPVTSVELRSLDARRRLTFLVNSLFMELPRLPALRFCREYTCLTPYYSEDILLSERDLRARNHDNLTVLLYLQTLYRHDWSNFCERLGVSSDDGSLLWWNRKDLCEEVRIWASCRAQTLYRTVEGMMHSEDAIRLLGELENLQRVQSSGISASDEGEEWILDSDLSLAMPAVTGDLNASGCIAACNHPGDGSPHVLASNQTAGSSIGSMGRSLGLSPHALACMKFQYVIACQVYGQFQRTGDPRAADINFLLRRWPALRVAYIDNHRLSGGETTHYSVLIRSELPVTSTADPTSTHDEAHQTSGDSARPTDSASSEAQIREVYRVKLPGPPVLGEGKPENQNQALIFTRGRYLQAIDMNQEGYFEEALKMRHTLQEFRTHPDAVIVGFREHIFTGAVSSVANYMALQELSFVTLGQRVLYRPLRIRQHYGHPDLFDKLFVLTQGGMSKASRGINLSEDVFAGFNATSRGYSIPFVEYQQVGKGRDVGLQQTYKFEAKLAQGNAEQSLSRDISRLSSELDFFRLFSFYFGGLGHYLSNALIIFTLTIVCYSMAALALFGLEAAGSHSGKVLPIGVFQLALAGMGLLQTLPLCVTLTVEKGFGMMLKELSWMIASGGPLYFLFHIQTKAFYFSQTILAGGAKYRPTGRGFVTRHTPFSESFRFFAVSHIHFGIELAVILIVFSIHTLSTQVFGLTWSLWLAAIAFIFGPFWFNPLSFEWGKLAEDYVEWRRWMSEGGGGLSETSWWVWWKEETAFYSDLSIAWKACLLIRTSFLWLLLAYGIAGDKLFEPRKTDNLSDSKWSDLAQLMMVLLCVAAYGLGSLLLRRFDREWTYPARRFASLLLSVFLFIVIGWYVTAHRRHWRYLAALYYVGAALACAGLLVGQTNFVAPLFHAHDTIVGHVLFAILSALSLIGVGSLQTWLLYHNALSRGVEIEDILKYARRSKDTAAEEDDALGELRQRLDVQAMQLQQLLSSTQQPYQSAPVTSAPIQQTHTRAAPSISMSQSDASFTYPQFDSSAVATATSDNANMPYNSYQASFGKQTAPANSIPSTLANSVSAPMLQNTNVYPTPAGSVSYPYVPYPYGASPTPGSTPVYVLPNGQMTNVYPGMTPVSVSTAPFPGYVMPSTSPLYPHSATTPSSSGAPSVRGSLDCHANVTSAPGHAFVDALLSFRSSQDSTHAPPSPTVDNAAG